MDIVVEVRDLGEYSARDFITIDNPSFHLEPGESQDVTATINVPLEVGEGGRYAIISIAQKPVAVAGISSLVAIEAPVCLTIIDSQLIHEGEITEVSASEVISGKPVSIFITFKNNGNHHFKFKGEVTVSDAQGEVLDTIYTAVIPSSVIPSMSKKLKADFIPEKELPSGVYFIKARVMLEDGTVLDEASGSFEVKHVYEPPTPVSEGVVGDVAPETVTPAPGAGVNWPLIGGVIAGVIVIALLIFLVIRRRAY
ncbi:hypothetical protein ES703_101954 [subsurface metagenome]